jgi:hypothetical protein
MTDNAPSSRLYVCHEPERAAYAERIDFGPRTNDDAAEYAARCTLTPDDPAAGPILRRLAEQIKGADVFVCVISQTAGRDPWVRWEVGAARARGSAIGLVGVLLDEQHTPPEEMKDCGAIFVPFRRTSVARAIEWAQAERHDSGDFTLLDE